MTGKSALPVLSVLVAVLFGSLALALALGNGDCDLGHAPRVRKL